MSGGRVIIGFGNAQGKLNSCIIQDDYHVIQRIGSKIKVSPPMIRPIQVNQLELQHLKNMIGQRRNQALLNSFLNISNQEEGADLFQLKQDAKNKIRGIKEELDTMKVVAVDLKKHNFVKRTSSTQQQAQVYLKQFKDIDHAVEKFKQRQNIIREFANKNGMPFNQAEDILKANGYNAKLFD